MYSNTFIEQLFNIVGFRNNERMLWTQNPLSAHNRMNKVM